MKRAAIHIIYITCSLLLLAACRPTVPKEYIQPDDMEDILYDYFISQGIAQGDANGMGSADYKRELYLDALLKKHEVSRVDFDSSLVYYYTRADRFIKILKNVQERLGEDAMELGASASEVERFTVSALTGDTANIWNGVRSLVMIPYPPYNHLQFSVKADTAFRQGDSFMLTFYSDFLYQGGSKDACAYMAVKYANDSVATTTTHFSVNGRTQLRTSSCDKKIKEVCGFIYLGQGFESTTNLRLLLLSEIQLVRFHKQKDEDNKVTVPVSRDDSLQRLPDSLRPKHHRLGERPLQVSGKEPEPPLKINNN